ncbi:MAG TPA: c-type cytochrome, partial [Burkholderiaceae bacterium]|nr:c-type cytochrome [Burkholderiaceae bacterium]
MLLFAVLSAFSFLKERGQVTPDKIAFGSYNAVEGKRVFQSYNCMGCHTIVGNGAYFGPDLTKVYERAGPAWLAAFLPSAASWPTSAAVRTQLQNPAAAAEPGSESAEAYFKHYPGAAERVERRGGGTSFMPNLPLTRDEVGHLVAFLKYTSLMNNEGWPPTPKVDGLKFVQAVHPERAALAGAARPAVAAATPAATAAAVDPAKHGASLAQEYGCMSCHSSGKQRLVGPGWGGLYGIQEKLASGAAVPVDDAYLAESIREPDAKIVAGYPAGVMPAYASLLKADEVDAVVAYIRSLKGE